MHVRTLWGKCPSYWPCGFLPDLINPRNPIDHAPSPESKRPRSNALHGATCPLRVKASGLDRLILSNVAPFDNPLSKVVKRPRQARYLRL